MNTALLQLGSNMGNSRVQFAFAQRLIVASVGEIVAASSLYDTLPWGNTTQHNFLNQVLEVQTKLTPYNLINTILSIEDKMGRVRNELYGARIIDIDILFINNKIIKSKHLTVPHPLIDQRRFVLTPLVEMKPNYVHPVLQKTMAELLAECTDTLAVHKI